MNHDDAPEIAGYYDGLQTVPDPTLELGFLTRHETKPRGETNAGEKRSSSNICGLRRRDFWIAFGAIFIAVVAGLGGAVAYFKNAASQQARKNHENPITTASATAFSSPFAFTPSSDNPNPPTPTTVHGLQRDCPNSNGTTYTPNNDPAQKFTKYCDAQLVYDHKDGPVFRKNTVSLNDCVELCVIYNKDIGKTKPYPCFMVGWRSKSSYCEGVWAPNKGAGIDIKNTTWANIEAVDSASCMSCIED